MGILRNIFGPSRDEMWRKLSGEVKGSFTEGGLLGTSRVDVQAGQWTISLDTYTVSTGKSHMVYSRMRAPYTNKDGFRFKVHRKTVFSNIGKLFGMQDVTVGYPEFDNDFIIQGNDERKLKWLFGNVKIRQYIDKQPAIHFEVKDDEGWFGTTFPEGVDELYFRTQGVIKDVERLKDLFDLFSEVLNHLCHIGSAYENDPGIDLR